jgi:hypothetical protein
MSQTNFLIGRGELLTHDIKAPKRNPGEKAQVYSFAQAVERLTPQIEAAAERLDALPAAACPNDFGVVKLTLNPSFIAKSFFPKALLRSAGLDALGSRTVRVKPERWTKKTEPREVTTTELFIAGKRDTFRRLDKWVRELVPGSHEANDLTHIERFASFAPEERIVTPADQNERYFEVGMHFLSEQDKATQQLAFLAYARRLGMRVHTGLGFRVGSLWFVPLEGDAAQLEGIAQFVFVRVIRPMPKLRGMRPVPRTRGISVACQLPTEQPLSSEPSVAILDGGLPKEHVIGPWLKSYKRMDEAAEDDPDGPEHGLGVTSSFLFGPIAPDGVAARPYSYVNHLRVLDRDAEDENPLELYRTLGMVEQVLLSRQYEFINLSLGPDLPMEDTEVHAWTSVIDDILSDGDTLMTIAAGNNGERDHELGFNRIQVPSDCVNAIAVGAANDTDSRWSRAAYSAIGPGRCPGVVKPDLMAFGGDPNKYFHVLTPGDQSELMPTLGTSFASPYLLRNAVGIRAILGRELTPLAIKALLVHSATPLHHDKMEVGWGKVPEDLMSIITCPEGVARVVYQGELKPGKYLRATLPLPKEGLDGNIKLKATFCYASPVDPQDAAAYTCAGLEVTFRPNGQRIKLGKANAASKSFFERKKYASEAELRSDSGKWETVLHGEKPMRGSSLQDPVFDIHYNARDGGAATTGAEKIRYALIITIEAPRHAELYNDILRAYQNVLVPIQPQVSIPIRI